MMSSTKESHPVGNVIPDVEKLDCFTQLTGTLL